MCFEIFNHFACDLFLEPQIIKKCVAVLDIFLLLISNNFFMDRKHYDFSPF